MKSFKSLFAAFLLAAACTPVAKVDITFNPVPESKLVVLKQDVSAYTLVDSLKADPSGHVSFKVELEEGQPDFVYVVLNGKRVVSLLLQAGDVVSVNADTLGHCTFTGSPESEKLAGVEAAAARFGASMLATEDPLELSRIYIDHYRECVRYVMANSRSLTVVPVLFEQLDEATPVFSRHTDAILFRNITDSLRLAYPESRYVAALERETARRESEFQISNLIGSAEESGYPDLEMPNDKGVKVKLSGMDSRAVLIHFWDSSDASQKMFNAEVLMPVWERWHRRGFEIYAIDVNPDKQQWAGVVRSQELPWVNVNDGLGAPGALSLYNVQALPASFLLVDGELSTTVLSGRSAFEAELDRVLR